MVNMQKTDIQFIEVAPDRSLGRKERALNRKLRRAFPECAPVKLYRTTDGRLGFQLQLSVALGDRRKLDELYRFISQSLGTRRGRLSGAKTVQTKLNLRQDAYEALRRLCASSRKSLSAVASELIVSGARRF